MHRRWIFGVLLSLGSLVIGGVIVVGRDFLRSSPSTLRCEGPASSSFVSLSRARSSWDSQTVALGVWHRGKMILECQQEGSWGIDRKWDLWSVSKSVLHAVVGVSVGLYGLNLDEPYQGLRARDLLEFRSGLQWRESYEWNPLRSSIIEALFDPTRDRSLPDFVLGHGQGTAKRARYSSGDSILLAEWLRSKGVTSSRIERDIFPRLGLSELELETDSRGLWMASSFTYGTINTLKNFGELYLGKGRQVGTGLNPAWVDALWEQQSHSEPGWALLPHWWSFKGRSSGHAQDWLVASGHWGQAVFLSRSQDLLIVRFGNDRFRRFDWDVFLDELAQVTRTHDR